MRTPELSQPLNGKEADAALSEPTTYEQWTNHYWQMFVDQEQPDVFEEGGLCISRDGGIKDVKKLLYGMQYFYAFLMVSFSLANIFMVFSADFGTVFGSSRPADSADQFLVSKAIANRIAGHNLPVVGRHLEKLVPFLEVSFLSVVLGRMVYFALYALLSRSLAKRDPDVDLRRWSHIVTFFWTDLPQLASFSAMKLLYYVTPSVVGTEAYVVAFLVGQQVARVDDMDSQWMLAYGKAVWPLVSYFITRTLCLIIGFDAFLVKFRMAIPYFQANDVDYYNVLSAITLLFQLLGVVSLNWFVRQRLFIFVFGGEDGNLDVVEKARQDVWNCILTKNIYQYHGFVLGTIIMLGFDDYDLQLLFLDVEAQNAKSRRLQSVPQSQASLEHFMLHPQPVGLGFTARGATAPDQDSDTRELSHQAAKATEELSHRAAPALPRSSGIFCCHRRPPPHRAGAASRGPAQRGGPAETPPSF